MIESIIIAAVGSMLAPIIHSVCKNDEPSNDEQEDKTVMYECDGFYDTPDKSLSSDATGGERQTTLSEFGTDD